MIGTYLWDALAAVVAADELDVAATMLAAAAVAALDGLRHEDEARGRVRPALDGRTQLR